MVQSIAVVKKADIHIRLDRETYDVIVSSAEHHDRSINEEMLLRLHGTRPERVSELLEANNREVERRRAAEHIAGELRESIPTKWLTIETHPTGSDKFLLLTKTHGVVESWYLPGDWSETPEGREYDGAMFVCGDDAFQIEIEETPHGNEYGEALGWLPRLVLPSVPEE